MIRILNFGITILFYLLFLSGIIWAYNKICDLFNVHTDLPEPDTTHKEVTTYPEYPETDFNSWSQYINRQIK